MRMRSRAGLASLLAIAVVLGLGVRPPAPATKMLEPMMPGWERIFKVDWELAEKRGKPVLSGHVVNESPYLVGQVRLLVDGLDDKGEIVSQRVSWVFGDMTPFSRSYFETPAPGSQTKYQVRIFSYERLESGNGPLP